MINFVVLKISLVSDFLLIVELKINFIFLLINKEVVFVFFDEFQRDNFLLDHVFEQFFVAFRENSGRTQERQRYHNDKQNTPHQVVTERQTQEECAQNDVQVQQAFAGFEQFLLPRGRRGYPE